MERSGSITIPAGELRAALGMAAKVTERGGTIPILSSVLMEATGGELRVTGTDMERRITALAPAEGTLPPVPVPAARLGGLIAKTAAKQPVTIAASPGEVRVNAGPLSARIMTLEAEDFPSFGRRAGERWTVDAGVLRQIMARPAHAMCTEESRYYLGGIFLHLRQVGARPALAGCATDGHRMFLATAPAEAGVPALAAGVIVPRSTVSTIVELLQREATGATVLLACSDTQIAITGKGWDVVSKLVDGTFPEYERVIPPANGDVLHVRAPAAMVDHIVTVASINDERERPLRIEEGSGREVTLISRNNEAGEARLTLPEEVAIWESGKSHAGFSCQARYLADTCKTMQAGFRMHIQEGGLSPIRCEGDDGVAVLMPYRT